MTCSWPMTARPTSSSSTAADCGSRRPVTSRAWRRPEAAATAPGWGSCAATSTATAGPTWPSPTSSASSTTFYQNLGGGLFTDRTAAIGLDAPSRFRLGFGIAFLDADADGRLDLLTVNGHIADDRPEIPYAMPAQLMLGGTNGRLTDVSAGAGPPFQVLRLGRGLAVGDLDDDGRVRRDRRRPRRARRLFPQHGTRRPFDHGTPRGDGIESRRGRRTSHGGGGRRSPGRRPFRRRQLPIGERPADALRGGGGDPDREPRSRLAVGPG